MLRFTKLTENSAVFSMKHFRKPTLNAESIAFPRVWLSFLLLNDIPSNLTTAGGNNKTQIMAGRSVPKTR